MNEVKYQILQNGNELGSWTLVQIIEKIQSAELSVFDYLYDESKQDWVSILKHSAILNHLEQNKPAGKPKNKATTKTTQPTTSVTSTASSAGSYDVEIWYVLKSKNQYGPFAFTEMYKMLQQRLIFEFDYIWKPGMEQWSSIATVTEFNPESIEQFQQQCDATTDEEFFRRKNKRVAFEGSLIIHDNQSVWRGQSIEISSGGVSVIINNSKKSPGETIYIHFKPTGNVPEFNAVCKIMSKQELDGIKGENVPVRYGLKFEEVDEEDIESVTAYANLIKAA